MVRVHSRLPATPHRWHACNQVDGRPTGARGISAWLAITPTGTVVRITDLEPKEHHMGKYVLAWALGVPGIIVLLAYLFFN